MTATVRSPSIPGRYLIERIICNAQTFEECIYLSSLYRRYVVSIAVEFQKIETIPAHFLLKNLCLPNSISIYDDVFCSVASINYKFRIRHNLVPIEYCVIGGNQSTVK